MSKQTIGEQAEKQANAFTKAALSRVEKPPVGIGPAECTQCGDDIPFARRQAFGNGLCVYWAELNEKRR